MQILGSTTTYHGVEHRHLRNCKVRIIAVIKNAALPGLDDASPDYAYINDEFELERAGGVTANDRVEVSPWIEKVGRFSFVTSDPRAVDLACFAEKKESQQ